MCYTKDLNKNIQKLKQISYNFCVCVELLQLDTVVVEQVQFLTKYIYVNFGFTKKFVVTLAHTHVYVMRRFE